MNTIEMTMMMKTTPADTHRRTAKRGAEARQDWLKRRIASPRRWL